MNRQASPALQHKVSNRISDPSLPPRSESFSSGGIQQARTPPMHRSVEPQVPQRTTSISPALVRKNSPGNGPGLGPRAGAHLIRASNPDLRRTDISMETPLKRASSGSSSSSSTPSSQGGSNERGECCVFVPPPDVLHLQTGLWVPKEKTRPWANFHYSIALKHILTLKKISRSGNFITFLK
ncbi:hypothetical protein AMECASPLE_036792, partial [Ameca splendens]